MISAATGATLKVIGSSIAMVASGPMPGSTPISVPTETPIEAIEQVLQRERDAEAEDQVVEQIHGGASPAREQRIGQAEPLDEQRHREGREPDRQQQHLDELEFAAGRAEPTISTISAGMKPACSISRPNITSDSGSTTSARSDQLPSIFSLLRRP